MGQNFLREAFPPLVFEFDKATINARVVTRGLNHLHLTLIENKMREAAKIRYQPYLNSLKIGK